MNPDQSDPVSGTPTALQPHVGIDVSSPAGQWRGQLESWREQLGLRQLALSGSADALAELARSDDPGSPEDTPALQTQLGRLGRIPLANVVDELTGFAAKTPGSHIAISINSAPDHSGSRSDATLPRRTWRRLLTMAGLEILAEEHLAPLVASRRDVASGMLRNYWRDANLFGERPREQGWLLLCRRAAGSLDPERLREEIDDFLDLAFVREKKAVTKAMPSRQVLLNIHHLQDHLNLRPMLDVLDPAHTIALIREHAEVTPLRRAAIAVDLRRRGFRIQFYSRLDDLPLADFAGAVLISGSESSISLGHALSRQLVEACKAVGCLTLLLQHGVWIESFDNNPVSFGSEYVLAWGGEHSEGLSANSTRLYGIDTARGAVSPERFVHAGSPKFADALMAGGESGIEARLGVKRSDFRSVTLVGTNMHWDRHDDDRRFIDDLRKLARDRPEELFILKLHPAESFYAYEALRDGNLIPYDDILALETGYHTPRLLRSVDRVASSLSSLLVDAAVVGKPVFQFRTGNSLKYDGIAPRPMTELGSVIDGEDPDIASHSATKLAARYADADHLQFYDTLATMLERDANSAMRLGAFGQIGAYSLIERLGLGEQRASLRIADLEDLEASGLFDEAYYRAHFGDLDGMSPIEHFLTCGSHVGIAPRAAFDPNWYSRQVPELARSGVISVLHYIRQGAADGIDPHVLFRSRWYQSREGRLASGLTPLAHYLQVGEPAGASCHPLFDPAYYLSTLPAAITGSPLEHFLLNGEAGGDPHPSFSVAQYLRRSGDLVGSGVNPLVHYLAAGAAEGRHRSVTQRHI